MEIMLFWLYKFVSLMLLYRKIDRELIIDRNENGSLNVSNLYGVVAVSLWLLPVGNSKNNSCDRICFPFR